MVDILKSLRATQFTVENAYKAVLANTYTG